MGPTDRLITRLLEQRDVVFDPPPLVAAVAEEVLGPSGVAGTPHRRVLERVNGMYLFDHALHLLGACEAPPWHSLRAWNAASTWRAAYEGADEGLVFFAEDAFGDQFAYSGRGGEVVMFEAERGRAVPVAPSFVAWLEEMLDHPARLLPLDVIAAQRGEQKRLDPGMQLFAYPPLCTAESRESVELGHVDAIEAMRFRGQLASRIRDLPPGARVEIKLEE